MADEEADALVGELLEAGNQFAGVDDFDGRQGGVMASQHSGGRHWLAGRFVDGAGGGDDWEAGGLVEIFDGDAAEAEDFDLVVVGADDGGFDADLAGAAVEDVVDAVAELVFDVLSGRGADATEEVGAGGCDGDAGGSNEFKGERVIGHAQADFGETGSDEVGDGVLFGEQDRQRAGPEGGHQFAGGWGDAGGELVDLSEVGDVDDERVEEGAVFGFEDACDGGGGRGVAGEAVDGLGRHRDDLVVAEEVGGEGEVGAEHFQYSETFRRREPRINTDSHR